MKKFSLYDQALMIKTEFAGEVTVELPAVQEINSGMAERLWRHLRHQSSGRQEAKRYRADDGIERVIYALRADKKKSTPRMAGVIKLTERLKYAEFSGERS